MKKFAIRDKETGEIILLPDSMYEVLDAFIVPLQCYYKSNYEAVNKVNKKEKKNDRS